MKTTSTFLGRLCLAALSLILLAAGPAHAAGLDALPLSVSVASSAAPLAIGELFHRLDAGRLDPAAVAELRPITLAQLEDQLRRPELQASIGKGTIAVLYPNVAEPFRSAFVSMIQGIEERTR